MRCGAGYQDSWLQNRVGPIYESHGGRGPSALMAVTASEGHLLGDEQASLCSWLDIVEN